MTNEEIIKEFREYIKLADITKLEKGKNFQDYVEQFLLQALNTQKAELRERVKGMKQFYHKGMDEPAELVCDWNDALDEVLGLDILK